MIICDKCLHKMYCIDYGRKTDKCEYFDQMTNEEWFCQLPTEGKAKVIVDLGRKQRFPKDVEVEFCEQWLKEEHKE